MSRRKSERGQEYRAKGAQTARREAQQQQSTVGPHRYRYLFHAPPITGPGGKLVPFTVPEEYADDLGRHIERAGLFSREALAEYADADGRVQLDDLPPPIVRHDPPLSGPRGWLNPGPWVPADAPAPPVAEQPDLTHLSDDEAAALEIEKEALDDALRRRAVWRERLRQADPEGRENR